jgi:hypothetical protein
MCEVRTGNANRRSGGVRERSATRGRFARTAEYERLDCVCSQRGLAPRKSCYERPCRARWRCLTSRRPGVDREALPGPRSAVPSAGGVPDGCLRPTMAVAARHWGQFQPSKPPRSLIPGNMWRIQHCHRSSRRRMVVSKQRADTIREQRPRRAKVGRIFVPRHRKGRNRHDTAAVVGNYKCDGSAYGFGAIGPASATPPSGAATTLISRATFTGGYDVHLDGIKVKIKDRSMSRLSR